MRVGCTGVGTGLQPVQVASDQWQEDKEKVTVRVGTGLQPVQVASDQWQEYKEEVTVRVGTGLQPCALFRHLFSIHEKSAQAWRPVPLLLPRSQQCRERPRAGPNRGPCD